jgi:hypothetical protein
VEAVAAAHGSETMEGPTTRDCQAPEEVHAFPLFADKAHHPSSRVPKSHVPDIP